MGKDLEGSNRPGFFLSASAGIAGVQVGILSEKLYNKSL
jgi:hypothetical protein